MRLSLHLANGVTMGHPLACQYLVPFENPLLLAFPFFGRLLDLGLKPRVLHPGFPHGLSQPLVNLFGLGAQVGQEQVCPRLGQDNRYPAIFPRLNGHIRDTQAEMIQRDVGEALQAGRGGDLLREGLNVLHLLSIIGTRFHLTPSPCK